MDCYAKTRKVSIWTPHDFHGFSVRYVEKFESDMTTLLTSFRLIILPC
jgi:hypothetical protein